MRWQDMRRSDNVDDRTGESSGGGGGFPIGGIPLSGGAIIVIVIVSLLFGVNPLELIGLGGGSDTQVQVPQSPAPGYGPQTQPRAQDPRKEFVARVLGDTEDVWSTIFRKMNKEYVPPRLELYSGAIQSACGRASAAVGPFYCPADRDVYLDTAFFGELRNRFGAPGDFASAYVIAHEVGHHVQNLLGTMRQVDARLSSGDPRTRNAYSVRLELQADCYAGVWGHYAQQRNLIDTSDIEGGIRAAEAVGDDNIQKRTRGYVVPDSFTHGSSAQRARWFRAGLANGDPRDCDTFNTPSP